MFWRNNKKKEEKKPWEKKAAKRGISKPTLVRKLDKIFSLYIRLRDCNEQGAFRCISCGRYLRFENADAGHYIGRANMSTRYSEINVHAQCRHCNRYLDGNILEYRKGLVKKIGEEKVEWLEYQKHVSKNWSLFELQQMIEFYTKEVEKLKVEKNYNTCCD